MKFIWFSHLETHLLPRKLFIAIDCFIVLFLRHSSLYRLCILQRMIDNPVPLEPVIRSMYIYKRHVIYSLTV